MNEETKALPVVAWDAVETKVIAEMDRRFLIREENRMHDDALAYDDTMIGVEFALEQVAPMFVEELAQRDAELAELRGTIASLRQHKNEYMDAAEETRKALQAELAAMRSAAVTVLTGLNERIDHAVSNRLYTPIFEGIAALHAAVNAAPSQVAAWVVQAPKLQRSLDTWAKCEPRAMAKQSFAAVMFAFEDAQKDIAVLGRALLATSQGEA